MDILKIKQLELFFYSQLDGVADKLNPVSIEQNRF